MCFFYTRRSAACSSCRNKSKLPRCHFHGVFPHENLRAKARHHRTLIGSFGMLHCSELYNMQGT
jgi:hypothetical protein